VSSVGAGEFARRDDGVRADNGCGGVGLLLGTCDDARVRADKISGLALRPLGLACEDEAAEGALDSGIGAKSSLGAPRQASATWCESDGLCV